MQKCKILIFLAVWKRPKITELCFLGIERLKKHSYFEIETLAVISEEEMKPLCEKYNVNYILHENLPLGRKKNAGLNEAKKFEFDYLLEIGSDDLILNELLDSYIDINHDFFGVRDIAYLNSETGECRRVLSKSTYGAGRMISRKLLEKVKFKLWDDGLNSGLDNNSIINVMSHKVGYLQVRASDFPMVIDVKSEENIWKFNSLLGGPYDKDILFEKISSQEVDFIKSMYVEQ